MCAVSLKRRIHPMTISMSIILAVCSQLMLYVQDSDRETDSYDEHQVRLMFSYNTDLFSW